MSSFLKGRRMKSSSSQDPGKCTEQPISGYDSLKPIEALKKLGDLFSLMGPDPHKNIHIIVRHTNEVLQSACSLYNRLDNKSSALTCWSGHNLPEDFQMDESPDGHICYESTIKGENQPVVIPDISKTRYQKSDKLVKRYGLKSYLGYPVHCNGIAVGSLAVVDLKTRRFDENEIYCITALANAISLEEDRIHNESERSDLEKSRLSARLQQAQKMEAIATLAGGVAHQFNNALAVIMGNLELIGMEDLQNERISLYIDPIGQAGQKMVQLTGQLLAYARGGKFQTRSIAAHTFVKETLRLVKHSIAPKIEIQTDLDKDTSHIDVDLTQMQMLLAAILSNASEAMDGQGLISIHLNNTTISPKACQDHPGLKPGNYVLLSITDNGRGMDEQTRARSFEPFFTTKFQGRGLGMAAVYGIVKKHGGFVYVDSVAGDGTTVSIYLKGAKSEPSVAEKVEALEIQRSGTALIVEDEHLVMEVNRAIVEKLGYRVLEARTGEEAIELIKSHEGRIDFVLLDVILPDMDGSHIYPRLVEIRPGIKVIVCSGFALDGPARQILESGAESFVQKPFTMAALSAVLKKIFNEDE
jgi:signal transduction histidine kinase/CheY-like chemotaxis protein